MTCPAGTSVRFRIVKGQFLDGLCRCFRRYLAKGRDLVSEGYGDPRIVQMILLTAYMHLFEAAKTPSSVRKAVFKPEGGGEECRDFILPTLMESLRSSDSAMAGKSNTSPRWRR